MNIQEFMTQYGVRATVTHLLDYVTHSDLDESGRHRELARRRWSITYEYADLAHGDQRVLTLDYDTDTGVGPVDVDTGDVLAQVIVDACYNGRATFEEHIDEYGQFRRQGHTEIVAHHSGHPEQLYQRWIALVHMRHRLLRWCSSAGMRSALDEIQVG